MKALRIHEFGGIEKVKWEDVPEPENLDSHEVKVKVKAGALNHLDIWVREGLPGVPVDLPLIQGCDMSGEVLEVGSKVTTLQPGDAVLLQPGHSCGHCKWCYQDKAHYCKKYGVYGETCDGGFCDIVVRPEANLFKFPKHLSWGEAAALPLVSMTAWEMVMVKARLQSYETLLVLGASSGIGSQAIQIGRIRNARVIAITSGAENALRAKNLGADEVVDRLKTPKFAKTVKKLTNGQGADVIFEHTGEATFVQSQRCLAHGGRMVICGGTTGPMLNMDVRYLFSKQWEILGSSMGSVSSLTEILSLVEKKLLKPIVGLEMPMSEGALAQKILKKGSIFGKIVLNN